VRKGDVLLSCLDNHASRLLLSQRCDGLTDVVMISGGNDGVGADDEGQLQRGTLGSVQVHWRRGGIDLSPTLTHHHPEIAQPKDKRHDELSCTEAIASQPQILFTNLMTASCMLNTMLLLLCRGALHYSDISFDIAEGPMRPVIELKAEPVDADQAPGSRAY
jgi:hypothetical protein